MYLSIEVLIQHKLIDFYLIWYFVFGLLIWENYSNWNFVCMESVILFLWIGHNTKYYDRVQTMWIFVPRKLLHVFIDINWIILLIYSIIINWWKLWVSDKWRNFSVEFYKNKKFGIFFLFRTYIWRIAIYAEYEYKIISDIDHVSL